MIARVLTLVGLGLGMTPGIRFAKSEETVGEMESYFFPSQKTWMDALKWLGR